jgi:hypothetical protein
MPCTSSRNESNQHPADNLGQSSFSLVSVAGFFQTCKNPNHATNLAAFQKRNRGSTASQANTVQRQYCPKVLLTGELLGDTMGSNKRKEFNL